MRSIFLTIAIFLCALVPAAAQVDSVPKVQARLVAETDEIAPGGTVTVALEQNIRPSWHTYWPNPGEAGLPTEVKWSLPTGWHAGGIEWPYPKRLPVGPLMNYGYEGKVWLLTKLMAPRDAKPGDVVNLKAAASWLVCQEVCIPEDRTLTLPLTVTASPTAPYATVAEQFAAARAKIPSGSPWPVNFDAGNTLRIFVRSPQLAKSQLVDAIFFPMAEGIIAGMVSAQKGGKEWDTAVAAQTRYVVGSGLVLDIPRARARKVPHLLTGVLVLTSVDGSVQALSVSAKPGAVPSPGEGTANTVEISLALALLFALLGGVILNLMPCVLPILAMKALAIANTAHGDRREATIESFAYGIGAVLSFAALGLAIILLRASGEAIGWGFQLQSPIAVAGFALLVFVVALNLSGVFEVAGIGAGEGLTRRGGPVGAFFTGVLAVAVAAPCTAPFMAAALGYALTQSAAVAMLVFVALGIGFAAPFVLIGLSPTISRWLPKPGGWMQRFRQFLAFPMYATALWLVWVLSFESDASHVLLLLGLALLVSFALWIFGSTQGRGVRARALGWLALIAGAIATSLLLVQIGEGAPAAHATADVSTIPSQPYSAAALASLRAQHRAVFVNATAAWCITCLVNEKAAFSSNAVRDAFTGKHIAYLVADWTSRNPEITALLQAHGRSGVPLYLYYAPGAAEPVVLPQVLSPGVVLSAIGH